MRKTLLAVAVLALAGLLWPRYGAAVALLTPVAAVCLVGLLALVGGLCYAAGDDPGDEAENDREGR